MMPTSDLELHAILLSGRAVPAGPLPGRMALNTDSFRLVYPGARHTLYDDLTLRDFIETHFDADVTAAYDALLPLAFKADLGRYCLLFEKGGVYSDLSIHHLAPITGPGGVDRLTIYRDFYNGTPWIVSNSLIAAPPRAVVFERCIRQICEHVRSSYYGDNALCPTGPNLFGRQIALHVDLGRLHCGDTIRIDRGNAYPNFAYLSLTGDVQAIRYKASPGIASLGGARSDNYNSYYNDRAIYAHDAAAQRRTARYWLVRNPRRLIWPMLRKVRARLAGSR